MSCWIKPLFFSNRSTWVRLGQALGRKINRGRLWMGIATRTVRARDHCSLHDFRCCY